MLRLCLNGTSSVGPFLHSSSQLATDLRPTELEKKYNSFGRRKVVQWNVGCWKFNFQRKALSLIRKLLVGFLAPQTVEKENTDRIPFALTFHPHNQAVKSVILKNLLQNDSEIGIPTNSRARFLRINSHNPQFLQSLWLNANSETLYGGQFTLSTHLIILN